MNKQESKNQVSIIINGVRYDAVEIDVDMNNSPDKCIECDMYDLCATPYTFCFLFSLEVFQCYKKSDKKFEV
jgi:hypothetical protein